MMRRCLFLDRDGVINVDKGYIANSEDISFNHGIFDLCREATKEGWLIVIVTNQGGIGRGFLTQTEFTVLSDWMIAEFAKQGAAITRIYHCPYHPLAVIPKYQGDHICRKPNPGMFISAQNDFDINMEASIIIGDSHRDLVAADRAEVDLKLLYTGDGARPYEGSADTTIADDSVSVPFEELRDLVKARKYLHKL